MLSHLREAIESRPLEQGVREGVEHVERSRVPPCATAVPCGLPRSLVRQPSATKVDLPRLRSFPSDPDQLAEVSADMDIQ